MCYLLSYSNKPQCFTSFLYELMFCQMTEISILFLKSTLPSILLIVLPLVRVNIFIIVIYPLFFLLVFCADLTWALAHPLVVQYLDHQSIYQIQISLADLDRAVPREATILPPWKVLFLVYSVPSQTLCQYWSLWLILKILHSCEQFYCHLFTELGLVHSMPMYIHGLPLSCFLHHV